MSDTANKPDYKNSLNLPKTDFPMKADLANKEPERIRHWSENQVYQKMISNNAGKPKFTLHDGPPYANGHIHFGHILNKVLKDFIVKYKNLAGFQSEYIPGWDCHGLPIEHQVDKDLGSKKKEMSLVEIRQACRKYAEKFVNFQRDEFVRLGILGDWQNPYLTMNYDYEATIERELGKFVASGAVYRGRKPVHWCMNCRTALAEAEVEYENHSSPSVYVKFPVLSDLGSISEALKNKQVYFIIWTTTPWTLPSNQAIALHRNYTYAAIEINDEVYLVAEGLLDQFRKTVLASSNVIPAEAGISHEPLEEGDSRLHGNDTGKLLDRISAKKFENLIASHPFLNRESKIVLSDHVTLEQGTGVVHIAPAHGQEDYEVGLRYQLQIFNPVDQYGKFLGEVHLPEIVGKNVFETNPIIIQILESKKLLLKQENINHSYPHCWRCKKPVIFRSTDQWFISMEKTDLRHRALDAIRRTEWVPSWGRERIYGMVENRPDWCISRQRSWGVPIVAFSCKNCREVLIDQTLINRVADLFEKEGADAWFTKSAEELLPANTSCPKCQSKEFEKEKDILDVWFDSGVSYAAVLKKNPNLQFPADLYLEGSDQHRGWFHSSLLASIGTEGVAPYKTVLTHGFVVDGEGKKYSKSAKNYVDPEVLLKNRGAEILRLWVAAEDYRNDIRVSDEILLRLTETYRKIRNTFRYLLGNLSDFNPDENSLPYEKLIELDRWALNALARLVQKLEKAYSNYEFHQIYHSINQFCTVELSSFYLDILKDRLYTSAPASLERRSAQTVLFQIAKVLTVWMAPILSFTAEEVWQHLPPFQGKTATIFLNHFSTLPAEWMEDALEARIQKIRSIREEILKGLEEARKNKVIGSSLEAQVKLTASEEYLKIIKQYEKEWPTLLIVSQVVIAYEIENPTYSSKTIPDLQVLILPAEGKKCERCWNYTITVGKNSQHPLVCDRCAKVLTS